MDRDQKSAPVTIDLFPLSLLAERGAMLFGNRPVFRVWNGNGYDETTYAELWMEVQAVARWLMDRGFHRYDRVALLSENRTELGVAYLGVQAAGGVAVPVDSQMPPEGIQHVMADSGARFLFASAERLSTLGPFDSAWPVKDIVCFGSENPPASIPFSAVLEAGSSSSISLPSRDMDEMAAILYTSGTTGHSKGVVLSQTNIMSNVTSLNRILPLGTDDVFLSVLPMHHAYECTVGFLLPLYAGSSITIARSLKSTELLDDMRRTGVTILVGVPLLFEKMHAALVRRIRQRGSVTRAQIRFLFACAAGGEHLGRPVGRSLFAALRSKAGLGTVRYFISGGAALDPAISTFFNRLGISMLQGYGLTETSPVTHVNRPGRVRHGTVGPPIPEVESRIADPGSEGIGEICIRGPNVFHGYYNDPDATGEVFDKEGWFHTGDLGRIQADHYLTITGRKKSVLVTAGGKNVYPEEIEQSLNRSRFIVESIVLGAERESGYGDEVVALVHPDYKQVDLYFDALGRRPSDDDVARLVKSEIDQTQRDHEDFKRIRRFRLVEEEFQKTSTRKIKRFLYDGDMLSTESSQV